MSDEYSRYLELFPKWVKWLGDDCTTLLSVLCADSTNEGVRRCVAGALGYVFKSLDLVPDGVEEIGYADDAFVLRVTASHIRNDYGLPQADLRGTLARLAQECELVRTFLGDEYALLDTYVRALHRGAVRGRLIDDIVQDSDVRNAFAAEVSQFVATYVPPAFPAEQRTLLKLHAYLTARLRPPT